MPKMYDPDLLGADVLELHEMDGDDVQLDDTNDALDMSVQGAVTRLMDAAIRHFEEDLEPDMVNATNYYYGRPFGDEEDGRSKVVSRDVLEVTQAQLASLYRVFTGPDRIVEFGNVGLEDAEMAEEMTSCVEFIMAQEGRRLAIHSWIKDALVRRLGWVKWGADEVDRITETRRTNLTYEDVLALIQELGTKPGVELDLEEDQQDVDAETGETLYTVCIRRTKHARVPWFAAIPPEEIVFTSDARDVDNVSIIAHVREVPKDELLAMGIPEKAINKAVKTRERAMESTLKDARLFSYGGTTNRQMETDPGNFEGDQSRLPVQFAEAYGYFDADGDGIAELRMFQCLGAQWTIVNGTPEEPGEIIEEIPLAFLTMDPEPHTIVGLSNYDFLKDVQLIKSHVERGQLNSLSAAIEPKTEVVMGEVNLKDLTSPEINGIVRVRRPGMMREITHEFVGPSTLPVLQYYNEIRENRTGISKAAAGLDPDSLQSSTRAAVAATVSGAQQHLWLIAQVFAETGFRRLFRGLARLIAETMEPGTMRRIRSGAVVPIDPSTWNLDMDITVNVAVGMGTSEERVLALQGILEKQEAYLQQGVPFVTFAHIRNTINRLTSVLGYRNDEEFFGKWGLQEQQAYEQQMAQQEPPPNLEALLLEVERGKVQLQSLQANQTHEREMFKLQLEARKVEIQAQKVASDAALKEFDIEASTGVDLRDQDVKMKIAERQPAGGGN